MSDQKWFLDDSWESINRVIAYGFGRVAKANIDGVINEFQVSAIIDNNQELSGKTYRDIPIIPYNEYKRNEDDKIVITATGRALRSIKESLQSEGLVEFTDFVDLGTFVNEWYLRFKDQLNLGRVAQPITQRCTLRCKDCQLFMPYITNPQDDAYETVKRDVDTFFALVDHVSDFDIIGGEPLLYPELARHIEYVSETYGNQIENLQLITNATIIPNEEIINTCKKHGVHIRISDYSHAIPYGKRVREFIDLLEKEGIRFTLFSDMVWTDFGYPFKVACVGESIKEQRDHMVECNGGMSRLLHNGRIYFCNPGGGAYEAGVFHSEEGDYMDLAPLLKNRDEGRRLLQLYCMGVMEKGAMSICRYCSGYCGGKEITSAIQNVESGTAI